jgi:Tol biopolymer transport system component
VGQIDERLRRDLERVAEPADPAGVADRVLRLADRRRSRRRAQIAFLALVVVGGSIGGVLALARVFRTDDGTFPGVFPVPIEPHANGRIAFAFSERDGMSLETIQPDGSDQTVLPTPEGLPWLPAWSPDGNQLAVAIFPLSDGPRAIWVMDADGANAVRIAEADNVSQPAWSPDAQWILYTAQIDNTSAIHLVRPDGSGDRILHQIPAPGTKAIFSAAFSPDGIRILFDQGTDSGFDVYVMEADGSDVRPITYTGQDYDPAWSPDGTRIAFTRQGSGAQSDIYVMDADGSNVVPLTRGGEGETDLYPTWSPDGTKIAYLAGKNGGPGDLVVMNADGSHPWTLVSAGPSTGVLGISWQPLPARSPRPQSAASSASPVASSPGARFARYFFYGPGDTGVLEVNLDMRSICYSTQSSPARPIQIVRTNSPGGDVVASYAPSTGEYCARHVPGDLARDLIDHPTLYAIRWMPTPGGKETITPLTPQGSPTNGPTS